MAYSSSNPIALMQDGFSSLSPRIFTYQSSHASTDIIATGFFTSAGDGSRNQSSPTPGLRLGDIVISRASTNPTGGVAGRVTMHSVISSTANVASTAASSGWNAGYDCTVASAT